MSIDKFLQISLLEPEHLQFQLHTLKDEEVDPIMVSPTINGTPLKMKWTLAQQYRCCH
eukprot:m.196030 g.196030  ORF g.196030 m.196030 type:complete len:58 (+) comp39528_c2_seq3:271-444(+)